MDAAGDTYTVNVSSVDNSTNITMTTTFPGEDIQATSFLYNGEPTNSKFLKVYNSTTPVFQVSGDSVMSGTTDLLDIFASSAITNQDVYWTATTDGTSISPSGSNVTTTVRMSGDTHIKGNLGVTGNTYVNGYNYSSRYYINEQIGISYHGASSTYRLFNIDDSNIGIGAYTNQNSRINLWGAVTASGDISASGNIYMKQTAGTDNSVVVLSNGKLVTDEIQAAVWGSDALLTTAATEEAVFNRAPAVPLTVIPSIVKLKKSLALISAIVPVAVVLFSESLVPLAQVILPEGA